ncbi:MAG: choice-of-anchor D domain-containing protein, partial [Trebonia sp.]
ELTAAAAGFYAGGVSFGTNATLDGTFQFYVSGGVAQPRLDIADAGGDVTSYGGPADGTPSPQGSLDLGATVVGTTRGETFTVTNTGDAELALSDPIGLPAGFTLTQDFLATTLAPGASTTFSVALTSAAAGDYSGSITFGTNLPNAPTGTVGVASPPGTVGATFSLPIQGEVLALSGFRLWDDTGYSASDSLTSDPTVAGEALGLAAPASVGNALGGVPDSSVGNALGGVPSALGPTSAQVQFSTDGGATIDGAVEATGGAPFTFMPTDLTPGPVAVDARIHLVDAVLGDLYTDWSPVSFTLETGTDAAPLVTNLALQTVTDPAAPTPTSSDPTITGSVLNDGNAADMTVQIDTSAGGTSG